MWVFFVGLGACEVSFLIMKRFKMLDLVAAAAREMGNELKSHDASTVRQEISRNICSSLQYCTYEQAMRIKRNSFEEISCSPSKEFH